ncbi:unnamed protein product [Nyctereutes procyonoides]|uniref:(raccoon dog) hypothetical protein n=1 Tax=Nyctereutes procyonoides TaxID=34880 RepID=A0A811ZFG3_NYCPR|nr:unnamed protein product [Nyctereutes procyonoides]
MASQSQGTQQLLQAEKQAKEEAWMEVELHYREREQEFQSKQVEQATRCQVQGMQSSQQRNCERVLAQLLGMVGDVRPQVHPNYQIVLSSIHRRACLFPSRSLPQRNPPIKITSHHFTGSFPLSLHSLEILRARSNNSVKFRSYLAQIRISLLFFNLHWEFVNSQVTLT